MPRLHLTAPQAHQLLSAALAAAEEFDCREDPMTRQERADRRALAAAISSLIESMPPNRPAGWTRERVTEIV